MACSCPQVAAGLVEQQTNGNCSKEGKTCRQERRTKKGGPLSVGGDPHPLDSSGPPFDAHRALVRVALLKSASKSYRVCCSPAIQHQIVQQIESELRASPPCCRQPNARLPVSRVPPSVRCSHERPKLPKALGWSRLKLKPVATRNLRSVTCLRPGCQGNESNRKNTHTPRCGSCGTRATLTRRTHPVKLSIPTIFCPTCAPNSMSVRRDSPRHMTVLPGGGSLVRAR